MAEHDRTSGRRRSIGADDSRGVSAAKSRRTAPGYDFDGPAFMIGRRAFLMGAGPGALTLFAAPPLSSPAAAQSKGFVSTIFGGVYEQQYRKWILDSFEKTTGAKVTLKLGAPGEWFTSAVVNRSRPEIDMLLLPYPDSIRAVVEDIGIELKQSEIPNLKDIIPFWWDQYNRKAVGLDYVSYGIGYRTDLVKTPPTSWADIWNPEYAGKLSLPSANQAGLWQMIVAAAKINGGSETNLDPGFKALRELKGRVRKYFRSSPETVQLLETGEVAVMAMGTDINLYSLVDANKPVKFIIPKEGAMVGMVSYHIAKNTPNQDLCKQLINHALSKEVQEGFCSAMGAGPVTKDAELHGIAKERVPRLDSLLLFDWLKVIPNMPAILERWNREIGG